MTQPLRTSLPKMNPNFNQPTAWLQINFSPLLSKSQSFDEVSHRRATRMQLLQKHMSPYVTLKQQPDPINLHPSAVLDFYNNPNGYFLNQLQPCDNEIQMISDANWFNSSGGSPLHVNAADANSPQAVYSEFGNPDFPVARSHCNCIAHPLPLAEDLNNHSFKTASASLYELPVGFDYGSEIQRVYYASKYRGFSEFFNTLKSTYPLIEKVKSESKIRSWYYNQRRHDKNPEVSSNHEQYLEIPDIPKGFYYLKEFEELFNTGQFKTAAPFAKAVLSKYPFILKIQSRKQILAYFNRKKLKQRRNAERSQIDEKLEIVSRSMIPSQDFHSKNAFGSEFEPYYNQASKNSIELPGAVPEKAMPVAAPLSGLGPFQEFTVGAKNIASVESKFDTANSIHYNLPSDFHIKSPLSPTLGVGSPNYPASAHTSEVLAANGINDLTTENSTNQTMKSKMESEILSDHYATQATNIITILDPDEQSVPSNEFDLTQYGDFFNTPSMKFLDDFFEETLFG